MEWTFTGAPEYHIICDIPVLRASADNLESKAQFFAQIADSLSALSTDEWQGTAADAFRERFILEPARWTKVQESFLQASQALANYADAMESCQRSTGGLAERYSMANHLMRDFNNRMESGENCDGFEDPSHLYSEIEQEYGRICSDAVLAGQACARALQRACQDAPEERTWLGELVELVYGMGDFFSDTFEFLTAPVTSSYGIGKKYYYAEISGSEALGLIKRPFENAYDVGSAFRMDPWGTIKSFGSAVLDVEKFADDPARVLGNLLPDVALTVGTGGAGLLLKSGSLAKKLKKLSDLSNIFQKKEFSPNLRHLAKPFKSPHNPERSVDDLGNAKGNLVDDQRASVPSRVRDSEQHGRWRADKDASRNGGDDRELSGSKSYENDRSSVVSTITADNVRSDNVDRSIGENLPSDVKDSLAGGDHGKAEDISSADGHNSANHHQEISNEIDGASDVESRRQWLNERFLNHEQDHTRLEWFSIEQQESIPERLEKHVVQSIEDAFLLSKPFDRGDDYFLTQERFDLCRIMSGDDPASIFGGLSPEKWKQEFLDGDSPKWATGDHLEAGALADTVQEFSKQVISSPSGRETSRFSEEVYEALGVRRGQSVIIDRFGRDGGEYFALVKEGVPASFAERSMTPSVIHSEYRVLSFDLEDLPNNVTIKMGTVAPDMGQPGGATQLLFLKGRRAMSLAELFKEVGMKEIYSLTGTV